MLVRRFLTSLGLVLAAAACAENLTSPPVANAPSGPHFVRWAGTTERQFAAEGARSERLIPFSNPAYLTAPVVPAAADYFNSAAANASTVSWSHTTGMGANRLLVVGVSVEDGGSTVTAVTYNGAALTRLGTETSSSSGLRVEMWYLTGPASGTATVSVTLSGAADVVGGSASYSGVDQFAPFRGLVSSGSASGTTATVDVPSDPNDVVVSVEAMAYATNKNIPLLAGQTAHWQRVSPSSSVSGRATTASGADAVTVGWTYKQGPLPWALIAASIKPFVPGVALTTYQATFWAKRGQSRSLQINYAGGGGTSPFMKLTLSDPTYVPGRGNLAVGDSVLVTATVDPNALTIWLEPHQMRFGTPAQMQLWYTGAGGDLNGDGVVNSADATIEQQLLGMWYQADPSSPWSSMPATKSLSTKSFTAVLAHFSGYAVSW